MSWGPIPNKVNKDIFACESIYTNPSCRGNYCPIYFVSLYFIHSDKKFISGSQILLRYSNKNCGGGPLTIFPSITDLENATFPKRLVGEEIIKKYSKESCIVSSYSWGYVLEEFNKDLTFFDGILDIDETIGGVVNMVEDYTIFSDAYNVGLRHYREGRDPDPNYLFSDG